MAGDWIPMRLDLAEDPAVMHMAEILDVREEVVVGYLHKVWSWASRQCHDGRATNVTLVSLGRVTNLHGFPEVMRDAGWLTESEGSDGRPVLVFPKWENWLGESAKKRVANSKRQQKRRSNAPGKLVAQLSRESRDESATTGEERRGEERTDNSLSPGNSQLAVEPHQEWKQQWELWVDTWEGRMGKRFDPAQAEIQLMSLTSKDPAKAKADLLMSLDRYAKRVLDSDDDYSKRNQSGGGRKHRSELTI